MTTNTVEMIACFARALAETVNVEQDSNGMPTVDSVTIRAEMTCGRVPERRLRITTTYQPDVKYTSF